VALCRAKQLIIVLGEVGSAGAAAEAQKLNKQPWACGAAVAQRTHNPLVAGSNPAGPNFK
jgi:hypothetical protein